jgi:adenine deaminase
MDFQPIITTARGDAPCDLLLTNARIVNVFSGRIIDGSIAIKNGYIVGFGDYKAADTVDVEGRFVAPGFIDSHVHIESSMACVTEFARAVAPCGTTTVVADPHEIANVLGTAGIDYMLRSAEGQPMDCLFALPSCVPATDMETAGARLNAVDLAPFMDHPRIVALAEMMNYPGVIFTDADVMAKLALARHHHRTMDGHAPGFPAASCPPMWLPGSPRTTSAPGPRRRWKNWNWACISWCARALAPATWTPCFPSSMRRPGAA